MPIRHQILRHHRRHHPRRPVSDLHLQVTRPMRRAIQEKVENALADALLKEKIERRDTVVLESGGVINIEKGKKL